MTTVSQESVLTALKSVMDPDLGRDIVSLGMVHDLLVHDGKISLRVVLTTPACPLKAKIESDVRAAVRAVPGVRDVEIKMDSDVTRRASPPASQNIPGVKNIIAVSSGKGGVGKSTVSANLALSLSLDGASVGLMDADIYGPNMPTMMGVIDSPRIEQDSSTGKEYFIAPMNHGVRVMSMGFLVPGDQPMIWRGPMLHSVVNQFCHQVKWGNLDYLIVDMPPGTGDVQLSLAQLVPVTGAVMVTTPQEISLQDVRKAFLMWEKVRIPVLGVVENMSYFKCPNCESRHTLFGSGGGKSLSKKFHVPLLSELPIVGAVREGGDEGSPIVVREPHSAIATSFREMARHVAQQVSILNASVPQDAAQVVQIGKF